MVFDNLLHSKHQKLILQCYPPGKAVDKKPNPSELSYLLYYASTRRVKLEKVFSFLHKRTISDVGRKRAGNLQVTLGIISSLIEKCADNLNVFANEVCLILLLILKIKDVALSKSALTTYGVLCSNLDGGLFYGDKVFIDQFKEVSQQLINITSASSSSDLLDWKLISMLACSHVTNCLAYNSKLAKYFVSLCIPLCVDVVKHGNTEQELKGRLNNNMELTKIILSKSQQVPPAVSTVSAGPPLLADGEITNEDVEETALSALKCYFDTMVTSQITESTKILVRHCFNIDENKWGRVLLEICTTWVPVQLRFAILSTLLQRVTVDFLDRKDFKFQIEGANYILGLLLSEINMIGLSVSDVIQQLLTLQSRVVLEKLELQSSEVDALVGVYSDCICNIATYVYYVDQVPDSIQEILIKIDSTFGKVSNPVTAPVTATTTSSTTIPTSKSPHTATATGNGTINGVGSVGVASSIPIDGLKLSSLIIIYMNNISKILNTLKQKPSTITRNHVKLEHWEISLSSFTRIIIQWI